MAHLKNVKHERFARFLAGGMDYEEAYEKAGFAPNRGNAFRLTTNEGVQNRLAEIMEDAAVVEGITPEKVIRELSNIAFANAGDFFMWDADGVTVKASDQLTKDQLGVVCQVEETRLRGERTIKIRMASKLDALEKLMRYLRIGQPDKPKDEGKEIPVSPIVILMERLETLAGRIPAAAAQTSLTQAPAKLIEGQAMEITKTPPSPLTTSSAGLKPAPSNETVRQTEQSGRKEERGENGGESETRGASPISRALDSDTNVTTAKLPDIDLSAIRERITALARQ